MKLLILVIIPLLLCSCKVRVKYPAGNPTLVFKQMGLDPHGPWRAIAWWSLHSENLQQSNYMLQQNQILPAPKLNFLMRMKRQEIATRKAGGNCEEKVGVCLPR